MAEAICGGLEISVGETSSAEADCRPIPAELYGLLTFWEVVDGQGATPDYAHLSFTDSKYQMQKEHPFSFGAFVDLRVTSLTGEKTSLLCGEVVGIELDQDERHGNRFRVVIYDCSHRLNAGTVVRGYPGQNIKDIASSIAEECGLTLEMDFEPAGLGDDASFIQTATTNRACLNELANLAEAQWSVQREKLLFKKVVAPEGAPAKDDLENPRNLLAKNMVQLRITKHAGGLVPEVQVPVFDPATMNVSVGVAPVETTMLTVQGVGVKDAMGAFKKPPPPLIYTEVACATVEEAQQVAGSIALRVASQFCEVDGVAPGNPWLHSRTAVHIEAGSEFSGDYQLSTVRHHWDGEVGKRYLTNFTASGVLERSFHPTPPSRRSGGSRIQLAKTMETDPQGRVKVALVSLGNDAKTNQPPTTAFLPVVSTGGGGKGGVSAPWPPDSLVAVYWPGQGGQPYILGGVNVVDDHQLPVEGGGDHVDKNTGAPRMTAVASPNGNQISLVDHDKGAGIKIKTKGGVAIHLDDRTGEVVITGKLRVEAGDGAVIFNGSDVELNANNTVTLAGQQVQVV